jgi:lysozyme
MIKGPIAQHEYDALVSFVYNIGVGDAKADTGFASSTTLRELNAWKHDEAADAMRLFNKVTKDGQKVESRGLKDRRERERELFLTGRYEPSRPTD